MTQPVTTDRTTAADTPVTAFAVAGSQPLLAGPDGWTGFNPGKCPHPVERTKHMSRVVEQAVADLNNRLTERAQVEAGRIVQCIIDEKELIKNCEERIAENAELLNELQEETFTPESVGVELPPEGQRNENQQTIAKVFEVLNKGRQDKVRAASSVYADEIARQRREIAAARERISKHHQALAKIEPEVVSADEVMAAE